MQYALLAYGSQRSQAVPGGGRRSLTCWPGRA